MLAPASGGADAHDVTRRVSMPSVCLALAGLLLSAPAARALEEGELRAYGFSGDFSGEVRSSRRFDLPAPAVPGSVPSPVVPGDLIDPKEIPGAPEYVTRVVRQRRDGPTPGVEGLTAGFPGEEQADREEGTFKEVEDFFFRPTQLYRRLLMMNETGVTGLFNMPTAEIPRPGSTWLRLGVGYTLYDRFSGTSLPDDQAIEQYLVPLTYQSVPWRNLELSLQVMGVSEENRGFPIINNYELAGVREVAINAKYRFLENPHSGIQAAAGFGMTVGVERDPTRVGSNGVDYELYLTATKRQNNFGVHARGGFVFPNGEDRSNSGVPDITRLDFGVDFSPSDRLSFVGEVNYTDWRFVGTNTEAALGFKYRMSDKWLVNFGVPLKLENNLVEGYRYRVLASVQAQL